MPTIAIWPPDKDRKSEVPSPLPQLLRTPSGLALVELQGTVSTTGRSGEGESESESSFAASLALGRLAFPGYDSEKVDGEGGWDGKRVFLYVGQHQRMAGEVKKLAKPIAMLRRRTAMVEEGGSGSNGEELEVAEVIHFKVLFAHRPEPVGQEQQPQQSVA